MTAASEYRAGAVYYVGDENLMLPGEQTRRVHSERRPVVILSDQAQTHGTNALHENEWPSVLAVPISSSTSYKTRFDVKIPAGEANLPKKGWARVPATQALDKAALTDMLGQVRPETLDAITAQLLNYLGLIQPEPDEPHPF
jgi:mRNA-degrading endonuclease toxin of MazEF toxin-antitoxin module